MGLLKLVGLLLGGQIVLRSVTARPPAILAYRVCIYLFVADLKIFKGLSSLVPMDMSVQIKALLLASVFLIVSGSELFITKFDIFLCRITCTMCTIDVSPLVILIKIFVSRVGT